MSIRPDVDEMIAFLNELLDIDRSFVEALTFTRLPCNQALARHPTVQVGGPSERVEPGGEPIPEGQYRCGLLGVLNGYFGSFDEGPSRGWGALGAVVATEAAEMIDECRLLRFVRIAAIVVA